MKDRQLLKAYKFWNEIVVTANHAAVPLYRSAKSNARVRNIEFLSSFEEWVSWWELNLGPNWISMRGWYKGKYVMARNGDKGPYHPLNVRCILHEENDRERAINKTAHRPNHGGERNPKAKLTKSQIKAIYRSKQRPEIICTRYKVSACTIRDIRAGRTWAAITGHDIKNHQLLQLLSNEL